MLKPRCAACGCELRPHTMHANNTVLQLACPDWQCGESIFVPAVRRSTRVDRANGTMHGTVHARLP